MIFRLVRRYYTIPLTRPIKRTSRAAAVFRHAAHDGRVRRTGVKLHIMEIMRLYGETRYYVIHAARAGRNIVTKNARVVFENETARGKDSRGEWRKTIDGRILEAI